MINSKKEEERTEQANLDIWWAYDSDVSMVGTHFSKFSGARKETLSPGI